MLANGAKLGYKEHGGSGSTYTDLPGLKEIPDMGEEPEKVENTCLTDKHNQYEKGIGDAPDLEYTFKYDNKQADSPYRVLRNYADSNTMLDFEETLADGTKTTFSGTPSLRRTGGGVNGVLDFVLTIMLSGDLTVTDPAGN
ncbi:MAG: phage tail protein [Blautia sp.]|nr:phage tail protein [Blautia sp.]